MFIKFKILLTIILLIIFFYYLETLKSENIKDVYITIGDNLNIREKPNINSVILGKIRIASPVRILKKSNIQVEINNIKGTWVFIDSFMLNKNNKPLQGWVFDYYLAHDSNFKKSTFNCNYTLKGWVEQYIVFYKIFKNGIFINYDYDENGKIVPKEKGNMVRYKNVLKAVNYKGVILEAFYLTGNDRLCSTSYNAKGEHICAECQK